MLNHMHKICVRSLSSADIIRQLHAPCSVLVLWGGLGWHSPSSPSAPPIDVSGENSPVWHALGRLAAFSALSDSAPAVAPAPCLEPLSLFSPQQRPRQSRILQFLLAFSFSGRHFLRLVFSCGIPRPTARRAPCARRAR